LIRPVLEENQLLVFERKVLRMKCGPKIENGVCRRRYNHELSREFNVPLPKMSRRLADFATLVTRSEDPKTNHKEL
jgi:hypothetical protein